MKPTPELEAKGLRAYEQVLAFERLRTWRLPAALAVFPLATAIMGSVMWHIGHHGMAWLSFGMTAVLVWLVRFQWKQFVARHAENMRLLANLRAEYGDELPWVQVENHFAELEKLKRELAEARGSE